MAHKSNIWKVGTGLFCGVFLTSNCLLAYSLELNFWAERRKAALMPPAGTPSLVNPSPDFFAQRIDNSTEAPGPSAMPSIPPRLGSIRHGSQFGARPNGGLVIHIQDIHMNLEAQKNISAAIQHLAGHGQVDMVALEGATEEIDLAAFRSFPHQPTLQRVADHLLADNRISGPIHAALVWAGTMPPIVGIDDRLHYHANIAAYQKASALAAREKKRLEEMSQTVERHKRKTFNSNLATFDGLVSQHQSGAIDLGTFLEEAAKFQRQGQTIPPSLKDFLTALRLEKALNYEEVEAERNRLFSKLSERLTQDETVNLLRESVGYRMGEVKLAGFYKNLEDLCHSSRVDLSPFPALQAYFQYVRLCDRLDGEQTLRDVRRMESAIYETLTSNDDERRVLDEARRVYLSGKLVDFDLTPDEWAEYKERTNGTGGGNLPEFESFYYEAEIRDRLMTENLLKAMAERKAKTVVLVTGGFHAGGIRALAEQAGLSTISFVPQLTRVETRKGSSYLTVFGQEKSPLEKLFQGDKLFLAQHPMSSAARAQAAIESYVLARQTQAAGLDDLANWLKKTFQFRALMVHALKANAFRIVGWVNSGAQKIRRLVFNVTVDAHPDPGQFPAIVISVAPALLAPPATVLAGVVVDAIGVPFPVVLSIYMGAAAWMLWVIFKEIKVLFQTVWAIQPVIDFDGSMTGRVRLLNSRLMNSPAKMSAPKGVDAGGDGAGVLTVSRALSQIDFSWPAIRLNIVYDNESEMEIFDESKIRQALGQESAKGLFRFVDYYQLKNERGRFSGFKLILDFHWIRGRRRDVERILSQFLSTQGSVSLQWPADDKSIAFPNIWVDKRTPSSQLEDMFLLRPLLMPPPNSIFDRAIKMGHKPGRQYRGEAPAPPILDPGLLLEPLSDPAPSAQKSPERTPPVNLKNTPQVFHPDPGERKLTFGERKALAKESKALSVLRTWREAFAHHVLIFEARDNADHDIPPHIVRMARESNCFKGGGRRVNTKKVIALRYNPRSEAEIEKILEALYRWVDEIGRQARIQFLDSREKSPKNGNGRMKQDTGESDLSWWTDAHPGFHSGKHPVWDAVLEVVFLLPATASFLLLKMVGAWMGSAEIGGIHLGWITLAGVLDVVLLHPLAELFALWHDRGEEPGEAFYLARKIFWQKGFVLTRRSFGELIRHTFWHLQHVAWALFVVAMSASFVLEKMSFVLFEDSLPVSFFLIVWGGGASYHALSNVLFLLGRFRIDIKHVDLESQLNLFDPFLRFREWRPDRIRAYERNWLEMDLLSLISPHFLKQNNGADRRKIHELQFLPYSYEAFLLWGAWFYSNNSLSGLGDGQAAFKEIAGIEVKDVGEALFREGRSLMRLCGKDFKGFLQSERMSVRFLHFTISVALLLPFIKDESDRDDLLHILEQLIANGVPLWLEVEGPRSEALLNAFWMLFSEMRTKEREALAECVFKRMDELSKAGIVYDDSGFNPEGDSNFNPALGVDPHIAYQIRNLHFLIRIVETVAPTFEEDKSLRYRAAVYSKGRKLERLLSLHPTNIHLQSAFSPEANASRNVDDKEVGSVSRWTADPRFASQIILDLMSYAEELLYAGQDWKKWAPRFAQALTGLAQHIPHALLKRKLEERLGPKALNRLVVEIMSLYRAPFPGEAQTRDFLRELNRITSKVYLDTYHGDYEPVYDERTRTEVGLELFINQVGYEHRHLIRVEIMNTDLWRRLVQNQNMPLDVFLQQIALVATFQPEEDVMARQDFVSFLFKNQIRADAVRFHFPQLPPGKVSIQFVLVKDLLESPKFNLQKQSPYPQIPISLRAVSFPEHLQVPEHQLDNMTFTVGPFRLSFAREGGGREIHYEYAASGQIEPETYPLDPASRTVLSVGRDERNHIVLDNHEVLERHIQIEYIPRIGVTIRPRFAAQVGVEWRDRNPNAILYPLSQSKILGLAGAVLGEFPVISALALGVQWMFSTWGYGFGVAASLVLTSTFLHFFSKLHVYLFKEGEGGYKAHLLPFLPYLAASFVSLAHPASLALLLLPLFMHIRHDIELLWPSRRKGNVQVENLRDAVIRSAEALAANRRAEVFNQILKEVESFNLGVQFEGSAPRSPVWTEKDKGELVDEVRERINKRLEMGEVDFITAQVEANFAGRILGITVEVSDIWARHEVGFVVRKGEEGDILAYLARWREQRPKAAFFVDQNEAEFFEGLAGRNGFEVISQPGLFDSAGNINTDAFESVLWILEEERFKNFIFALPGERRFLPGPSLKIYSARWRQVRVVVLEELLGNLSAVRVQSLGLILNLAQFISRFA